MRGKGAGGPLQNLGGDLRHGDGRGSMQHAAACISNAQKLLKGQKTFHKRASPPKHMSPGLGDAWRLTQAFKAGERGHL